MGADILSMQPVCRLTEEDQWAKYFCRVMDACESPKEIDYVYQYWAECINMEKYRPFAPPPIKPNWESVRESVLLKASSIPAPPPATPIPYALRSLTT
jgi:hypothetical protein